MRSEVTTYLVIHMLYISVATTIGCLICLKPFMEQKKNKKWAWILFTVVYFLHDNYWAYWHNLGPDWLETVECVVAYGLFLIILHTQFKGKLIQKFSCVFALNFLMQVCSMIFEMIIGVFAVHFEMERVVPYITEYVPHANVCLTLSLFPGVFLTIQLFKLLKNIDNKATEFIIIILAVVDIIGLLINSTQSFQLIFPVFFLFLIYGIFQQNKMNRLMKKQFVYYSQIDEYDEARQNAINRFRHDISNHIEIVNTLQEKYVEELTEKVNTTFSGETGIKVIDCLLYIKNEECCNHGILLEKKTASLSGMKMSECDMISLMANLFDNAIEACDKAMGEKNIVFKMERRLDYLIIQLKNSKAEDDFPVKNGFKSFKRKQGTHGLGTKIINEIVEKYGGCIEYQDLGKTMEINLNVCIWE